MNMKDALMARLGEGATVMTTAQVQTQLGSTNGHSATGSGAARDRRSDPGTGPEFHPTLG